MGVTSFQQSLYEFFDSGLLFRIALLQKTILFLLFWIVKVMLSFEAVFEEGQYELYVEVLLRLAVISRTST